jgi:hypothetical protein
MQQWLTTLTACTGQLPCCWAVTGFRYGDRTVDKCDVYNVVTEELEYFLFDAPGDIVMVKSITALLISMILICAAFSPVSAQSPDAARVYGDLKVDGIAFSKDSTVLTTVKDFVGPPGPTGPEGPQGPAGITPDMSAYYTKAEVEALLAPLRALLPPPSIQASATSVAVVENGTAAFQIRLSSQPAANISVNVSSSDTGAVIAAPVNLTFTPANWAVYQTVTVSGVDDLNVINENVTLTLSGTGVNQAIVTVAVTDDDVMGIVSGATSVTLSESGSSTFQVRLTAQPSSNTTVTVSSNDQGAATVAPASLTFTPANWNVFQTVTVSGVQDADVLNEMVPISLSAGGMSPVTVMAYVSDDDSQNILVNKVGISLAENGVAEFQVSLMMDPSGTATVNISSSDTGAATVSPATLTFTSANYITSQTVTVFGINDPDAANENVTITVSSAGLPSRTVNATVIDDDVLGIQVGSANTSIFVNESSNFQVKLTAQPLITTVVTVSSSDPGFVTVNPPSLIFTPANWNAFQTVTFTGVASGSSTISLESAGLPTQSFGVDVSN